MIVEYNKIINGTDDVAKYLGLEPEKTIFLHSTSFNEKDVENLKRKAINKGKMIYSEILSYSSNKKRGSKSAISYFNEQLLDELDEIKVIKRDNIIKVTDESILDYPYNSVSTMLNKKVKEDLNFRKSIEGFNIVSSYISREDEDTANLINGRLLMNRKKQEKFNSKYEFRKLSHKYGFKMPFGIIINGLNEFEEKFEKLDKICLNYKNIWIKLESQSSGKGNLKIEDYNNFDKNKIKEMILQIAKKIYDEEYIYKEMPFIAEVDVTSNEDEEVANIGVEAVVTGQKVTILGGAEQAVRGSEYIGSKISENTYEYLKIAEETAKEAFISVAKEGYVGFMTIDVIVTKNMNTKGLNAYNIDPNARFSAGTMLLKNIHTSEALNKQRMFGLSFSNAIPKTDNIILSILDCIGTDIYSEKNNYIGIIPALINDINSIGDNKYYLKSVVIGKSYKDVEKIYNRFKEKIKEML